MAAVEELVGQLRARRGETIARLRELSEAALERPSRWRGGRVEVRFLLLQLADADDERRARLGAALRRAGWQPAEAARILVDLAVQRGRLLGILAGLEEAQVDLPPAPGEWPVRTVVGHIRATADRYTIHSRWAADRFGRGDAPIRVPDAMLPPLLPEADDADLPALRAELAASLDATLAALAGIADEYLAAPTIWTTFTTDLRFRLHRFAAHERQHLVQIEKTLAAIGARPSEARLILAEAEESRAQLLALTIGVPDAVAGARGDGESVLDVLAEAAAGERLLVESLSDALDER